MRHLDFSSAHANARNDGVNDVMMNGTGQLSGKASASAALLGLVLASTVILFPVAAKADGGVVRMRESQGSFIITIFSPPEVARDVPTEVAVMVQNRETGEVAMDAGVDLRFVAPTGAIMRLNDPLCGPSDNPLSSGLMGSPDRSPCIRAIRSQAANKLFYGTSVVFPVAGDWQVQAMVREGDGKALVTCALPVGMPPRRLARLWPYLALSPFAIALFAMNQWLRGRSASHCARAICVRVPSVGSRPPLQM
jgi:hypothetical protein